MGKKAKGDKARTVTKKVGMSPGLYALVKAYHDAEGFTSFNEAYNSVLRAGLKALGVFKHPPE